MSLSEICPVPLVVTTLAVTAFVVHADCHGDPLTPVHASPNSAPVADGVLTVTVLLGPLDSPAPSKARTT